MSVDTQAGPGGPRPRRHPRPPRRGARRRHPGLPRPRALGRPRLAAGGRRPRRDLDRVPDAEPRVPVGQQPRQPAVRLLHRRRHLARHRVHPDGRRDRPVGRLRVGLRVRDGRRALGQRRLAGRSARSWSPCWSAPSSARSTPCCSTGSACRASCRRWRACSPCWACSSTSWAPAARSTCPTGLGLVDLGQTLVMPHVVAYALVLIAGAALFVTGYRTAARRKAAGLTPPSVVGIAVRALVLTVALEIVAPTSTPIAACRGCSASSSPSSCCSTTR